MKIILELKDGTKQTLDADGYLVAALGKDGAENIICAQGLNIPETLYLIKNLEVQTERKMVENSVII